MNSSCHIIRASVLFDFHQTATGDNDREKKQPAAAAPPPPSFSCLQPCPFPLLLSIPLSILSSYVFSNLGSFPLATSIEVTAGIKLQNAAVTFCDLLCIRKYMTKGNNSCADLWLFTTTEEERTLSHISMQTFMCAAKDLN